jgi:hypothetical protein
MRQGSTFTEPIGCGKKMINDNHYFQALKNVKAQMKDICPILLKGSLEEVASA